MKVALAGLCVALAAGIVGACRQHGFGRGGPADNSYCFVCHTNFKEDSLATRHARKGIGCASCHGESDAHSADEDNLTAPDVMFAKEKIAPFCMNCHPRRKIARKREHKAILAGTATENRHCTDCHGTHRMAVRTRRWDKTTGELIPAPSVDTWRGE